jgi:uncharacterized phage protein (TIGR02220 family)
MMEMENKKSFILYCDLIHTVEKLTDVDAGQLFKHLLRYVNDQNPESDNPIVDIVFEPIKQAFKRDLKKWEVTAKGRSEAGMKSAGVKEFRKDLEEKLKMPEFVNMSVDEMKSNLHMSKAYKAENQGHYHYYFYDEWIKWYQQKLTNSTNVDFVQQVPTKSTVSVSVNDSVSVSVNDSVNVIYNNIMSTEAVDASASDSKITAPDSKKQEAGIKISEAANEIINIFNTVTGKKCTVNKSRLGKINKLLKAGYTQIDFKAVVEMKNREWANDEKMAKYLTPDTIFGEEKFTKYVEAVNMPVVKPVVERRMVY